MYIMLLVSEKKGIKKQQNKQRDIEKRNLCKIFSKMNNSQSIKMVCSVIQVTTMETVEATYLIVFLDNSKSLLKILRL